MLDYEFWLDKANTENVEILLFSYDPEGMYEEYEDEGEVEEIDEEEPSEEGRLR